MAELDKSLKNNFQYKLIQECTISNPEVIAWVIVPWNANPNGKNIIIGTIYRSPNQYLTHFMEEFNKILSFISKDNKQCYIMGDFNLYLFHYDQHAFIQEFMDSLFSHICLFLL